MGFLHPLLLGGLVTIGLPILLHLLMRQKPKKLRFPAFRFLQEKAKTNQRRIRLRHLILLLLRMLLLALVVLALARPRLTTDGASGLLPNQAIAAVIIVDTSKSMDYTGVNGKTRLEEARQRVQELLGELNENSRVAIIDPSEPGRSWGTVAQARERLGTLVTHPGCPPVTSAMGAAYGLFADLDREPAAGESEALPRFVYLFSDRTMACWNSGRLQDLIAQRDRLTGPPVKQVLVDVGVEKPIDVAILSVELKPQSVPANRGVTIKVTIAATGQGCDTEVQCKLTSENSAERRPVQLEPGQTTVVEFQRKDLRPGQYQAEITLATPDSLASNNVRFATFEVRQAQPTLIITDEEDYPYLWRLALVAHGEYDAEIKLASEIRTPDDLRPYRAVCMLSVRNPNNGADPGGALWDKLKSYVAGGGHLVILPGRDEMIPKAYNEGAAVELMPGKIDRVVEIPGEKGAEWDFRRFNKHPLLLRFAEWGEQGVSFMRNPRTAKKYWAVKAAPENVILRYAVKDEHPALLERVIDRAPTAGRVLLFTTPIDYRDEAAWNDYASTVVPGLLVALANETLKYTIGDAEEAAFNFTSGQALALPLPPNARFPEYLLDGPGVLGSDTRLLRGDADAELRIRQTDLAGNFVVTGGANPPRSFRFSLNPSPDEFLLERVPSEEIEKLFGPESVIPLDTNRKLTEQVGGTGLRAVEMFGLVMLLGFLIMIVEGFLANRFYKPEPVGATT